MLAVFYLFLVFIKLLVFLLSWSFTTKWKVGAFILTGCFLKEVNVMSYGVVLIRLSLGSVWTSGPVLTRFCSSGTGRPGVRRGRRQWRRRRRTRRVVKNCRRQEGETPHPTPNNPLSPPPSWSWRPLPVLWTFTFILTEPAASSCFWSDWSHPSWEGGVIWNSAPPLWGTTASSSRLHISCLPSTL